jgi:hypothetical protein
VSAVIVDAHKVKLSPVIGLSLRAGGGATRPTVFVTSPADASKDRAPAAGRSRPPRQGRRRQPAISLVRPAAAQARRAGALSSW